MVRWQPQYWVMISFPKYGRVRFKLNQLQWAKYIWRYDDIHYRFLIFLIRLPNMEVVILILKHHKGLCYDDNHNELLILLFFLPSMAIVAPTQNGTPKLRVYSQQALTQRQNGSLWQETPTTENKISLRAESSLPTVKTVNLFGKRFSSLRVCFWCFYNL